MELRESAMIKCRGIIIYNGKLLVVDHGDTLLALPGGKLENNETPVDCVEREIFEEFGRKPVIGRLLYINQYKENKDLEYIEFFFEIKNGADYLDVEKLKGTHSHEIKNILWITPEDDVIFLPKKLHEDFKNGLILNEKVVFIKD